MLANGAIEGLGEFAGKVLYLGFMLYMLGVVISGEMTPGDYAVILGYFLTMSEPAKSLGGLWLNIQGPAAKARRVFAMLDMDSEDDVGTVAMETVSEGIEFQQVGFTYPDGRVALSNVSFEARQERWLRWRTHRCRENHFGLPGTSLSRGNPRSYPGRWSQH